MAECKSYNIVLAAGGTGGHLFPAIALAYDLMSRGYKPVLYTDERCRRYADQYSDIPFEYIQTATFGNGILGKVKAVLKLVRGFFQAKKKLKQDGVDIVVGFGGYPSLPTVYAAQLSGLPTILHEQNAVLGKANVFLAGRANYVAMSLSYGMEETLKKVITGNPVRQNILEIQKSPYPDISTDGSFRLLVMGGSLGATVFSDVVPQAIANLPNDIKARIQVVQQCREDDLERTRNVYADNNITAEVHTFIHDIHEHLEKSHVIITRSGASSVAEIAVVGRPAIFVPYPWHKDQQQKVNAQSITENGGGWMIDQAEFTSEVLQKRLIEFITKPYILKDAAAKAAACGRPNAAKNLGNLVIKTLSENPRA